MRLYWITLIVLILINLVTGCHWFRGRKKRSTASEAQETRVLRNYFANCLSHKSNIYLQQSWLSNVDWPVLQTVWKIDTSQWKCSPAAGQDTGTCWKLAIDKFLKDPVASLAKSCIEEFVEDTAKHSFRYSVTKRTKRQVYIPRATSNYTQCLQENAGTIPGTEPLDFDALTDFVKKYTLYGCDACGAQCSGNEPPLPPDAPPQWPYRFLALTRADAPIRNAIAKCNEEFFPGNPFWSSWTPWDPSCATNCQLPGVQSRSRTCRSGVDPTMEVIWNRCGEVYYEQRTFVFAYGFCWSPFWATWGAWSSDCLPCGSNVRSRSRKCSCGYDQSIDVSSDFCPGDVGHNQREICSPLSPVPCYPPGLGYPSYPPNVPPIFPPIYPPIYQWSPWEQYGPCRGTCGNRNRSRSRDCQEQGITVPRINCETLGFFTLREETSPCTLPCWSKWSNWSGCNVGVVCFTEGTRQRSRTCLGGSSQVSTNRCSPGVESESEGCLCDGYSYDY